MGSLLSFFIPEHFITFTHFIILIFTTIFCILYCFNMIFRSFKHPQVFTHFLHIIIYGFYVRVCNAQVTFFTKSLTENNPVVIYY